MWTQQVKMDKKQLKKLMTDLAAGHITQEEADNLIKDEKVDCEQPVQEIEGKEESITDKTQKRKLNAKGGKK